VDLFDWRQTQLTDKEAPLAARMRPRTLDEFFGQEDIIGPGRLLRRAIQADQLSSLIFYGPPGTGKTTLARIIANTTKAQFVALNAVLSGVKDIRAAIEEAKKARGMHGLRSILFIDEVHRFNKAQQDALLPWVENGTVVLVGATTENPYFEVNKALVSRSRVFQLQALGEKGLFEIARAALEDTERGYGNRNIQIEDVALAHLVNVANGDARALLNALELAIETTPENEAGVCSIGLAVAEESIQKRAVLYDKEGDAHFDAISAFIKSCRGSDADAALFWLARMIYAGEDPRFVFRRLIILASEDVGLADPDALARVMACAQAFDRVGMPEGRFHLAQATLVIATAKKSNSTLGFFDALRAVKVERETDVPNHLKDASRDAKSFGHGEGYLYPHAYRDHWVAQQYLPSTLQGQVFYQPSDQGYEGQIAHDVARRREAQLAALDDCDPFEAPINISFSPTNHTTDRWLKRAVENTSQKLGTIRDQIFDRAPLQRHHVVLDLNAQSGLRTFEAIRKVPEGGVISHVEPGQTTLRDRSYSIPELKRPQILELPLDELENELPPEQQFDVILGYNALALCGDRKATLQSLSKRLRKPGRMVLAENIPSLTQRLYALVPATNLPSPLLKRWKEAEERIYEESDDPKLTWQLKDLQKTAQSTELNINLEEHVMGIDLEISHELITRWWSTSDDPSTYQTQLSQTLQPEELDAIRVWAQENWLHQRVQWSTHTALLTAACI